MAEIIVPQTTSQNEASVDAEIKRMTVEMDRLFDEMKQMQKSIDRTRASTKARLTEIEAALDRMAAK